MLARRRTEARLSAHRDGAGADDSGSECPTVAHMRAIESKCEFCSKTHHTIGSWPWISERTEQNSR